MGGGSCTGGIQEYMPPFDHAHSHIHSTLRCVMSIMGGGGQRGKVPVLGEGRDGKPSLGEWEKVMIMFIKSFDEAFYYYILGVGV